MMLRYLSFFTFLGFVFAQSEAMASDDFCARLLQPVAIKTLMKKVDWKNLDRDETSLDPSLNAVVYTASQKNNLDDLGLPLSHLSDEDRILETDYGYAILAADQLQEWQWLKTVIDKPSEAKKFIDYVANNEGVYPKGISEEAADWLRWSVFAHKESFVKAKQELGHFTDGIIDSKVPYRKSYRDYENELYILKRFEFNSLVRQKEIFIFPFGFEDKLLLDEIALDDAVTVLEVLARYFILSKLYVKKSDGYYSLLSSLVDKDTLMLFSRYPLLIPLYPMFEDGHFEIEKEITKIGTEDIYFLAKKRLLSSKLENGVPYNLEFNAMMDDYDGLSAKFSIEFNDYEINMMDGSTQLFAKTVIDLNALVAEKSKQFTEHLGIPLPKITIEGQNGVDDTYYNFIFTSNDMTKLDAKVYGAFLMFIALDN